MWTTERCLIPRPLLIASVSINLSPAHLARTWILIILFHYWRIRNCPNGLCGGTSECSNILSDEIITCCSVCARCILRFFFFHVVSWTQSVTDVGCNPFSAGRHQSVYPAVTFVALSTYPQVRLYRLKSKLWQSIIKLSSLIHAWNVSYSSSGFYQQ